MDTRLYWIWLAQALGPGSPFLPSLLEEFGSAEAVWRADDRRWDQEGLPLSLRQKLRQKSLDEAKAILHDVEQNGDWILTPDHILYPCTLANLPDPPAVLYGRGCWPDLDVLPSVAMVGTRRATDEGRRDMFILSAGLAAAGMVIVSGGAVGIDAAAHAGALAVKGRTVVVMACPLTENYPVQNEKLRRLVLENGGALVSEYPPNRPFRCAFPVRNRLLVGLSYGVCLGETPLRSGARITARLSRDQGHEVFALPGRVREHHNDGAHAEIRNGATLVSRAADILEAYEWSFPDRLDAEAAQAAEKEAERRTVQLFRKPTKATPVRVKKTVPVRPAEEPEPEPAELPSGVSEVAATVWNHLTREPSPADVLAQRTGLTMPALLAALTELEMAGCAVSVAGMKYKKR